ncbi:hypothetical protein FRC04_008069 [Tulasnella sp. 424]|nr:hypothetical protein FRC04_008069 [Tulasnella sp. 424]KAG8974728.1 hypothetical protein FRC05_006888 [Tulasnella sp. 425]
MSPSVRKVSNASLLDDDAFASYSTYGSVNENADYLRYQTRYNDLFQSFEQTSNHAPEDLTCNRRANPDASTPLGEPSENPVQPGARSFGKPPTQNNFVHKLYEMLDDNTAQEYIRWNPDGKSFVIVSQDDFSKNVLGRHLRIGNFQSFIRHLKMYDFHETNKAQRAQRGVQAQTQLFVFSHSKFQRGKLELLSEIKRKGTEQQDPPPQYETVSSGARFGPSLAQGHLPLPSSRFDYQTRILLQEENDRLRKENEQLKTAYARLASKHNALKASLRVGRSMPVPQTQIEESSSAVASPSRNLLPLEPTSLPGPSTHVPSPNIKTIRQPSPSQSRAP